MNPASASAEMTWSRNGRPTEIIALTPESAALACSALSATPSASFRMREPSPRARITAFVGAP